MSVDLLLCMELDSSIIHSFILVHAGKRYCSSFYKFE